MKLGIQSARAAFFGTLPLLLIFGVYQTLNEVIGASQAQGWLAVAAASAVFWAAECAFARRDLENRSFVLSFATFAPVGVSAVAFWVSSGEAPKAATQSFLGALLSTLLGTHADPIYLLILLVLFGSSVLVAALSVFSAPARARHSIPATLLFLASWLLVLPWVRVEPLPLTSAQLAFEAIVQLTFYIAVLTVCLIFLERAIEPLATGLRSAATIGTALLEFSLGVLFGVVAAVAAAALFTLGMGAALWATVAALAATTVMALFRAWGMGEALWAIVAALAAATVMTLFRAWKVILGLLVAAVLLTLMLTRCSSGTENEVETKEPHDGSTARIEFYPVHPGCRVNWVEGSSSALAGETSRCLVEGGSDEILIVIGDATDSGTASHNEQLSRARGFALAASLRAQEFVGRLYVLDLGIRRTGAAVRSGEAHEPLILRLAGERSVSEADVVASLRRTVNEDPQLSDHTVCDLYRIEATATLVQGFSCASP